MKIVVFLFCQAFLRGGRVPGGGFSSDWFSFCFFFFFK